MGRLFDSPVHLLILLLVIVVLFGAKRLPDAARGLGRSMRILKTEVRDMKDDDDGRASGQPGQSGTVEGRVITGEQRADQPAPAQPAPHDQRRDV